MNQNAITHARGSLAALRRLVQQPLRAGRKERCELCAVEVWPRHRHLFEVATRQIVCACDPCALRFQRVIGGRFKLIPRDVRALADFQVSAELWDSLALPISLAFIFTDSRTDKPRALYPSPAGATESLLPLSSWDRLLAENPALGHLEPEVEALLVNRVGAARDAFIAPIDRCFELVGVIRTRWCGLSGGDAVDREIRHFFQTLRAEAGVAPEGQEVSHA